MESSSDDEPLESAVVSRSVRTGRSKAPVKYFAEESDSDEKEKEGSKEWSGSGSDFDDDDD